MEQKSVEGQNLLQYDDKIADTEVERWENNN